MGTVGVAGMFVSGVRGIRHVRVFVWEDQQERFVPRRISKAIDDLLELCLDSFRRLLQPRILNGLHGGHWIDRGHFRSAPADILHHDVAGEHRPDFVFELERLMRERRVARAQDAIVAEVDVNLFSSVSFTSISVMIPNPSLFKASVVRRTASSKVAVRVLAK